MTPLADVQNWSGGPGPTLLAPSRGCAPVAEGMSYEGQTLWAEQGTVCLAVHSTTERATTIDFHSLRIKKGVIKAENRLAFWGKGSSSKGGLFRALTLLQMKAEEAHKPYFSV